jgi:hypothetical protein
MMVEVRQAIDDSVLSPYEKNVNVLLKTSALCREMGGTVGNLCKSGTCAYLYLIVNYK